MLASDRYTKQNIQKFLGIDSMLKSDIVNATLALNIKDKMSYLENFIYETAKHYSYLHLNSDLTNKSIEFWLKTYETTEGHHNLHWDRDESIPFSTNEKYNELTIISFLENTDSIIPTIITNVQRKHNIDLSNPDLFTIFLNSNS